VTKTSERAVGVESPVPQSPYLGLMPYTEGDAEFFFGRERETNLITDNLLAARLTLLYGPSGVGKSSVLAAGVVHHLRRLKEEEEEEEDDDGEELERSVTVVTCRAWRDNPGNTLAAEIDRAAADAGKRPLLPAGSLYERLSAWTEAEGDLLIILDQFEEYFLYHPPGSGNFADELAELVNRPVRVNLLISIREDSLAGLDRFKGKIPNLFGNYLRIEPLHRDAARRAIQGPLEHYNDLWPDEPVEIEERLVETVLDQVETGAAAVGTGGTGSVKAPAGQTPGIEASHLQLVMIKLWEEERRSGSRVLRFSTLEGLGGGSEIVTRHLDEAMASLSENDQRLAAQVFTRLVTPSGTKIAHAAADLAVWAKVPQDRLTPILERLASADLRILRPVAPPPDRPNEVRYEIFHDVLAAAALQWGRRYQFEAERDEERRQKITKWRRRVLAGGALVVLPALTAFGLIQWRSARTAQEMAEERRLEASSRELAAASGDALAVDPDSALRQAVDAVNVATTPQAENALRAALAEAQHIRAVLAGHTGAVTSGEFDPAGDRIVTASTDWTAALWKADTGERQAVLTGHTDQVNSASFSPDGTQVVTASNDGEARLWDAASGSESAVLDHEDNAPDNVVGPIDVDVLGAVFAPDGAQVLTWSTDGTARLWDASSGAFIRTFEGHTAQVNDGAFSPDGRFIATGGSDGIARVWNASTGRQLAIFDRHRQIDEFAEVLAVDFSPDGHAVATAGSDSWGYVWSWRNGGTETLLVRGFEPIVSVDFGHDSRTLVAAQEKVAWLFVRDEDEYPQETELHGHIDWVNDAAISPDGTLVSTVSRDGTARLWLASTGNELATLRGHTGDVVSVQFSPDGRRLVTTSSDGTARVWDVAKDGMSADGHEGWVISATYSPDGQRIVSVGIDGTARLWDTTSGKRLAQLPRDPLALEYGIGYLQDVAFHPAGRYVVTQGQFWTQVWDVEDPSVPVGQLLEFAGTSVAFDDTGDVVLTANVEGDLRLWRWQTDEPITVLPDGGDQAVASFSPDGARIAAGDADGALLVMDAEGNEIWRSQVHTGGIRSVAFSPDGRHLVTGSADFTAQIRDAETGDLLDSLEGHDAILSSASFSPDGNWVVTGAADGTVGMWRRLSETEYENRGFIPAHGNYVNSVEFSPNGDSILTASDDGTIRAFPCNICGNVDDLIVAAKKRLPFLREPAKREAPLIARTTNFRELNVGSCHQDPGTGDVQQVAIVDCGEVHDLEVFAVLEHPAPYGEPYPGELIVDEYAESECGERFQSYTGKTLSESGYFLYWFKPTASGWQDYSDRRITCSLQHVDGPITGSARDAGN
jgi:WD40 repeat protein